jgi:hypothetical protein
MNRVRQVLLSAAFLSLSTTSYAAFEAVGAAKAHEVNVSAIIMFLMFVVSTLGITWWASSKTRSMDEFYTAGSGITGFQNGLALAGDYMSAAALLGVTSMIFFNGYDGMIYVVSFFIAWPLLLFLFAERIRNLGRVTIADIASYRPDPDPLAGSGRLADCRLLLSRGSNGRRRPTDRVVVWPSLQLRSDMCRVADGGLCHLRRHGRHDMGSNHQGDLDAVRRDIARGPRS